MAGQSGETAMLREFRDFIARGNVLDLAVAVIIGAAFGTITTSLPQALILPAVAAISGGLQCSSHLVIVGEMPASYTGPLTDYAKLKEAGVAVLDWGQYLTVVINFVILAFVSFLLVRSANKLKRKQEAADPAPDPAEIVLLRE